MRHAIRKLRMPTLCSENAECIGIIIAREYSFLGTMRKSSIKMYFFYFKAFSHVMGYHDGTQNFTIRKYDILAFKWRVLSIFSIPGSKVIPKNKRTLVKCPGLYNVLRNNNPRLNNNPPFLSKNFFCRKSRFLRKLE